jgi:hypothetical protein
MDKYIRVTVQNIDEYLEKYFVLVCSIRNSRIKPKKNSYCGGIVLLISLAGYFHC